MKLISTLRPGTLNPVIAGKGNYGGDLRLFFTTLNPADHQPTPPPIMWQGGAGTGAADTYKLPSGDLIVLNLGPVADIPGRLYVFGAIQVTLAGGGGFGPPIGQASGMFVPGKPLATVLKGRTQSQSGAVHFDVGFELTVPWDGMSADCHGAWWAIWQ